MSLNTVRHPRPLIYPEETVHFSFPSFTTLYKALSLETVHFSFPSFTTLYKALSVETVHFSFPSFTTLYKALSVETVHFSFPSFTPRPFIAMLFDRLPIEYKTLVLICSHIAWWSWAFRDGFRRRALGVVRAALLSWLVITYTFHIQTDSHISDVMIAIIFQKS